MAEPNEGSYRGRGSWRARGRGTTYPEQTQSQQNRGRGWRGRGGGGSSGSTPTPSSASSTAPPRTNTKSIGNKPSVNAAAAATQTKRQMELIPSISRSSGLDKDGDSLKTHAVQETYREFIEEKLKKVLDRHDRLETETEDDKKHRIEEQENVLILFRKLREGISSSNRQDAFSIQVYEQSLYLSIIFASPKHTTAIIPALINDLYPKASPPSRLRCKHVSILVTLMYHLLIAYPSQRPYHQQWTPLLRCWIPEHTQTWLKSLTKCLRTGNYSQFNTLTQREGILQLLDKNTDDTRQESSLHDDLGIRALWSVVDALRSKVRATIWGINRGVYKELWLEEGYDTRQWLYHSLCLDSPQMGVDEWLDRVSTAGHIRKKEGTETRWIVTKV